MFSSSISERKKTTKSDATGERERTQRTETINLNLNRDIYSRATTMSSEEIKISKPTKAWFQRKEKGTTTSSSCTIMDDRGAGGDCPQLPIVVKPKPELDNIQTTPLTKAAPEKRLDEYESHFNWILAYSHSLSTEELVRYRQKVEIYKDELGETDTTFCYVLANGLQQSVLDTLIPGNSTQMAIDNLDDVLASFPPDLPAEHVRAYSYLVLIERCNILSRSEDYVHESQNKELLREISEIDLSDPKTEAAILSVKAGFLGLLGDVKEKLKLIKQVVILDPERSDWFRVLYYSIRRVRRERDFTSTPSDEEIDACLRAYELDPDKSLGCMAEMYHDSLKAYRFSKYKNKLIDGQGDAAMSREMIRFARRACDLNPNSVGLNIRLAEILCSFGVSPEFKDLDLSEKQYEYCLKKWPNSSHVLHKIGKFYITMKSNNSKGIGFYKRALETDSDNYPCLMDYLRMLYKQNCRVWEDGSNSNAMQYEHLIKILDSQIPHYNIKKVLYSKLMCSKAALLWKLKRIDEAIQVWLEALTQDPDILRDDIMKVLGGRSIFNDLLQLEDFKLVLETVKQKTDEVDVGDATLLEKFFKSLESDIENYISSEGKKGNNPNWRQTSSHPHQRGKYAPNLSRQLRSLSVHDVQPDWRSQHGYGYGSDTSSVISETSTTSSSYPAFIYPSRGDSRGRYRGRGQYHQVGNHGRTFYPSLNGGGDGFPVTNLQYSHEQYGSTTSISSTATQDSSSSMGSSFSRIGFQRPYNRDAYRSKCDDDDNWRRK